MILSSIIANPIYAMERAGAGMQMTADNDIVKQTVMVNTMMMTVNESQTMMHTMGIPFSSVSVDYMTPEQEAHYKTQISAVNAMRVLVDAFRVYGADKFTKRNYMEMKDRLAAQNQFEEFSTSIESFLDKSTKVLGSNLLKSEFSPLFFNYLCFDLECLKKEFFMWYGGAFKDKGGYQGDSSTLFKSKNPHQQARSNLLQALTNKYNQSDWRFLNQAYNIACQSEKPSTYAQHLAEVFLGSELESLCVQVENALKEKDLIEAGKLITELSHLYDNNQEIGIIKSLKMFTPAVQQLRRQNIGISGNLK